MGTRVRTALPKRFPFFFFLVAKCSVYLNRRVFVMNKCLELPPHPYNTFNLFSVLRYFLQHLVYLRSAKIVIRMHRRFMTSTQLCKTYVYKPSLQIKRFLDRTFSIFCLISPLEYMLWVLTRSASERHF